MRLKKFFSLFVVMLVMFTICSCNEGEDTMEIDIAPTDKSLVDLASQKYDVSHLLKIANYNGSMNELHSEYPIECLRKDNDIYRASYLGNRSIAVILFDKSGNRILGNIYSIYLLKSDFDALTKGQLLDEVREIDPNGEYLFLNTGRNDTPKISTHYTKDGYLITIEYDTSNKIISINEELI